MRACSYEHHSFRFLDSFPTNLYYGQRPQIQVKQKSVMVTYTVHRGMTSRKRAVIGRVCLLGAESQPDRDVRTSLKLDARGHRNNGDRRLLRHRGVAWTQGHGHQLKLRVCKKSSSFVGAPGVLNSLFHTLHKLQCYVVVMHVGN